MSVCGVCGFEIPEGCTCSFIDTDSIEWTGAGVAAHALVSSVRIDPDDTNQLDDSSGLVATAPSRFVQIPRVRVRSTASQTVANGTTWYLTFNTEVYDTDGMHAGSDNFITIKTRGLWRFGGCVQWPAQAASGIKLFIAKNNDQQLCGSVDPPAQDGGVSVQMVRDTGAFEVGDVLQLAVINVSGVSRSIDAVDELSPILWATFHKDLPNRRLAS